MAIYLVGYAADLGHAHSERAAQALFVVVFLLWVWFARRSGRYTGWPEVAP